MTRERPGAWADASPTTSLGPQQTKPPYKRDMGRASIPLLLRQFIYPSLRTLQRCNGSLVFVYLFTAIFHNTSSVGSAFIAHHCYLICYHALSSHIAKASRTRANISSCRLGLPFGLSTLSRVPLTLLSDYCDIYAVRFFTRSHRIVKNFCPDSTSVPSQEHVHCTSIRAEASTMMSYRNWTLKASLLMRALNGQCENSSSVPVCTRLPITRTLI